jgi:hypothetical protein
MNDERVVLLVEFTSGEVVAVPFANRDAPTAGSRVTTTRSSAGHGSPRRGP